MSDIIQNLMNNVLDDGARPSKYRAQIMFPDGIADHQKELDVICKATELPTKSNDIIVLKHKGRNIPIPGQEKFGQSINLTFYLDPQHKFKRMFEEWMLALNYDNYSETLPKETIILKNKHQVNGPNAMMSTISITQLNFDGDIDEVRYEFYNIFPKEISQVNLGSSSISTISEYTVSFSYTNYNIIQLEKDGANSNDVANSVLNTIQGAANALVNKAMGYLPLDSINKSAGSAVDMLDSGNKKVQNVLGKTIGTTKNEFLG